MNTSGADPAGSTRPSSRQREQYQVFASNYGPCEESDGQPQNRRRSLDRVRQGRADPSNFRRTPCAYSRFMPKNPGISAVLSFVVPGFGQIYNGDFLWAALWLIITPGFWLGTGGTLGFICHFISAYVAYRGARSFNRRAGYPELGTGQVEE